MTWLIKVVFTSCIVIPARYVSEGPHGSWGNWRSHAELSIIQVMVLEARFSPFGRDAPTRQITVWWRSDSRGSVLLRIV